MERGNVQLRDLPRKIHNEFHISRLRPYATHDEIPVAEDEYKVHKILRRRGTAAQRQYLVWWTGWPKSEASWEPQANLLTRCFEMLTDFDSTMDNLSLRPQPPENLDPEEPSIPRGTPIPQSPEHHAAPKPIESPSPSGKTPPPASETLDPSDTDPTPSDSEEPRWSTGDQVLVPASLWPDYECQEQEGQGWAAKIIQINNRSAQPTARIRFLHHRNKNGKRFADNRLLLSALRPLNASQDTSEKSPFRLAELLHQATQQAPATRAKHSQGVWHYERMETLPDGRRINRLRDERFYSPEELLAYEPLRIRARNLDQQKSSQKIRLLEARESNRAPRTRSQTVPLMNENSSEAVEATIEKAPPQNDLPGVPRRTSPRSQKTPVIGAVATHPWAPLTGPHQPDHLLLQRAREEMDLGQRTAIALVSSLLDRKETPRLEATIGHSIPLDTPYALARLRSDTGNTHSQLSRPSKREYEYETGNTAYIGSSLRSSDPPYAIARLRSDTRDSSAALRRNHRARPHGPSPLSLSHPTPAPPPGEFENPCLSDDLFGAALTALALRALDHRKTTQRNATQTQRNANP